MPGNSPAPLDAENSILFFAAPATPRKPSMPFSISNPHRRHINCGFYSHFSTAFFNSKPIYEYKGRKFINNIIHFTTLFM
jgi:hypothetical protein